MRTAIANVQRAVLAVPPTARGRIHAGNSIHQHQRPHRDFISRTAEFRQLAAAESRLQPHWYPWPPERFWPLASKLDATLFALKPSENVAEIYREADASEDIGRAQQPDRVISR